MVALPLRLPTATYGGHMGHFLLSVLILTGATPFANTRPSPCSMSVNVIVPVPWYR